MRIVGCVFVLVLAAGAAAEDEVKLKNGDRLAGKVTGLAGGKLVVETAHSGKLQVDWAQVVSVKTDEKVKVRVSTGETFEGKLSAGANGALKIESDGAKAAVEVDPAKVTHFNQAPAAWHGSVNLSGRATDGNTHTRSLIATADLGRGTEDDDFILRGVYRYGKRSGELQERNAYGLMKYSHKLFGEVSGFVSVELLSDPFKDLRLQTIVAAGLGYDLVKSDKMDLGVEAGVAYIDNNYRELLEDEDHVGGRVSARLRLDLPLGFQFRNLFTIYPNFEESQDFQIRNEATLTNNLGAGWSLVAGVITEYDRTPPPGIRRHDDTYFLGLGYSF
jgi:putative salt-induced outer membrane protein YdiY